MATKKKPVKRAAAKVAPVSSPAPGTVLILRTCNEDMTSRGGFRWPTSGPVTAPDWKPRAECGNGLHGFLRGEGDGQLLIGGPEAKWLVVEVPESSIVQLQGKVKFPAGVVVYCGDRATATAMISAAYPTAVVVGGTATAGDSGTATAGDSGTATAGDSGTATAGYAGTATAGDSGTATAGDSGTATAGDSGTATAGDSGTATAGDSGTATAGDSGTATAGYAGTATAGDSGTATAGYAGTATAGQEGILVIGYVHGGRRRLAVGYVGENGLKPRTKYRWDTTASSFVEVVS